MGHGFAPSKAGMPRCLVAKDVRVIVLHLIQLTAEGEKVTKHPREEPGDDWTKNKSKSK